MLGKLGADMKTIAVCMGLVFAWSANAADTLRAQLVGQRVVSSYPGTPILVCQYRGAEAKYEVVASTDKCAPYLKLSANDAELSRTGRPGAALAKTASP
jgi:hypothetical protein